MNLEFLISNIENHFTVIFMSFFYMVTEIIKYLKQKNDIKNLEKKIEDVIVENKLQRSLNETSSEAMTYANTDIQKEFIELKTNCICKFIQSLIRQSVYKITENDIENNINIQIKHFEAIARPLVGSLVFDSFMSLHIPATDVFKQDLIEIVNDDMFNSKKRRIVDRSVKYHEDSVKLFVKMSSSYVPRVRLTNSRVKEES